MAKRRMPGLTLSLRQARRAVFAGQHLEGDCSSIGAALDESGPVRTLGGVDVYLAVRLRVRGLHRAQLDDAVLAGEARVTPAMRGCIYLASRRQQPFCLALAERLSASRIAREHASAGIRVGEVEELAREVRVALAGGGSLSTHELRRALPAGAVRSLGETGKKAGISSPLPAALRRLEHAGEVERILEGGRLDSERYRWRRTTTSPFAGAGVPAEAAGLHAVFAELFFHAAVVGTQRDFATWAGLAQREAQAAMAAIELLPVTIAGLDTEYFARPQRRELLADPPPLRAVAFLPFADNAVALHGGPALLVDPALHGMQVPVWGRRGEMSLGEAAHAQLRGAATGDRLAGFWEYDPDAATVVVMPCPGKLPAALPAAARDLARFFRDELGHGRSYSLDTDEALRERAARLCQQPGAVAFAA